jgi:hypothetical protein
MTWEEPIAHQTAIAGMVVDGRTGQALAGVDVLLTAMPAIFSDRLKLKALQYPHWDNLNERPDRTFTRADGGFRFLDLPDGEYTLRLSMPGARHRYGPTEKSFTVARNLHGKIDSAISAIPLPPTAVAGQIFGAGSSGGEPLPLFMAEVRVSGTGERAFTGGDGIYYLTGVEVGSRVLEITAHGYVSPAGMNTDVVIKVGEISLKDFTLDPTAT